MPSLPQLDVQVVCVVRALGASHGSWGGENSQVGVCSKEHPHNPLCMVRKGGFRAARTVAVM